MQLKFWINSLFILFIFISSCSTKQDKPLPEFHLITMDGKTITEKDVKGKTIVFNVWGTWCGPCVGEIGHLNELVAKYKNDNSVLFIALADEDKEVVSNFLKRKNYDYMQISNASTLTSKLHPGIVKTIPLHVIVNKKGIISFEKTGGEPNIAEVLSAEIEKAK